MVDTESPLRLLNKTILNISAPYSRKFRLSYEDTVALPPISDESRQIKTALSTLTVRENLRVQFLLQLLGKNITIVQNLIRNVDRSEAEEFLNREAELDRSRRQEEAVGAMYDNLTHTLYVQSGKKSDDKKKEKYYLSRRDGNSGDSEDAAYSHATNASVQKQQLYVIKKNKVV
jgi:hypothetical protein